MILIGLAIAFVVVSIFLQFTYQEMFFSSKVSKADAIAEVISSTSDTRRRTPESFDFQKIKSDSALGNGDYIYSGEGSQVTVRFINGTRILIGEQSLVVLREVNGIPDLLIEQGAISGAFESDGEIEVQTKQESVILNGEKDAQFYVTYLKDSGLEIGSLERRIRIQYKGEQVDLVKSKARVSKNSGIQAEKSEEESLASSKPTDTSTAPAPTGMPDGMGLAEEEAKARITLAPPYPKNDQIFLHSAGGRIPVFPKLQCQGACEIRLSVNGKPAVSKKFERDMVPFIFLTVQPGIEAGISWEFVDGNEVVNGSFEVLKNTEAGFQKAFQAKKAVEVMN